MSSFPDPALDQDLLEAGLAAIKQGKYTFAIDCLNQYLATSPPDPMKANMGLVVAYAKSHRTGDAIALCQELRHSQNVKVQDWAMRTLAELENTTGFTPLESSQPGKRRAFTLPQPVSQSKPVKDSIQAEDGADAIAAPSVSTQPSSTAPLTFRPSHRPTRWQPLDRLNPARLQWAEMGTVAILIVLVNLICATLTSIPAWWVTFKTSVLGMTGVMNSITIPLWAIVVCLLILWFVSPWILSAMFKWVYGMKMLSPATLARSSPETHRLLQRFCQQHKIPVPKLGILSNNAPLILTYGSLPRFAHIVVSQGLLHELNDEEIAALYAAELGHIQHWDFSVMSLIGVVTQIPYTLYRFAAMFSDTMRKSAEQGKQENAAIALLLSIAASVSHLIAAANYGLFWYFRWSGLWLSRQRVLYSDRSACNLTGNPNGLTRALLKSAIATRKTIQKQGKTDYLLEGFELLTPLGYRTALPIGSLCEQVPLPALLKWDWVTGDRNLLMLSNTHPLMGKRLERLANYAQHWNTPPELDLDKLPSRKAKQSLLYIAPFLGVAIGYGAALLLWISAHIAFRLGTNSLNWLASDYKLFTSFSLIGFGIGTIARFNQLFPDIQSLNPKQAESSVILSDLLTQSNAVPLDSTPVRLVGRLLGRSGSGNGLAQDLILETSTGLIKLHYCSQLGAIGNLIPEATRPVDLIGQTVTLTGWFRRGATPWIDVDVLRTETGRTARSGHQVASTLLAIVTLAIGILLIL